MRNGLTAFQSEKRNVVLTHLFLHVNPWRKNSLTPGIIPLIEHMVQDFHSEVAHSHLINIRKAKRITDFYLSRIFYNAVQLSAGIARRLFHMHKYIVCFLPEHLYINSLRYSGKVFPLSIVLSSALIKIQLLIIYNTTNFFIFQYILRQLRKNILKESKSYPPG